MKFIKLSLAAALIASSLAAEAISVSGDASFTSNALWRGASLTADTATVQGTIGIEHESGLYAGAWGTGLTVGTEIDLYAGYATEISGIGIDGGFVAYTTTGPDGQGDYEYTMDQWGEIYLGLSYDISELSLSGTVYKGVLDADSDSLIVEAGVDYDFGMAYVGAVYGYQADDETIYPSYYSATVGMPFESIKGDLSFTYADADNSDDSVYSLTYTTSF